MTTANPRILVVEDEPSMQRLLSHVLRNTGFTVELADNGLKGRDALERDHGYALILSDVMMSGIDGIELCRWAKSEERVRTIPFVMLSSRAQKGEREEGLSAGADVFMTKPFDVDKLVETITGLIDTGETTVRDSNG